MFHVLPKLAYPYDGLEPYIDARTMELHHTKHHQGYVDKLNKALEGHPVFNSMALDELLGSLDRVPKDILAAVQNNGGGHANHSLFWTIMGPNGRREPDNELAADIRTNFGGFAPFQRQFTEAAMNWFGSGWVWLCTSGNGRLAIESTRNQDSPLMHGSKPILGVDLWEHAYYLQYQNRRADYINAWWHVVDWSHVADWYAGRFSWSEAVVHA